MFAAVVLSVRVFHLREQRLIMKFIINTLEGSMKGFI